MTVRLVKQDQDMGKEKQKKPVNESDIVQTVQSWVKEFKTRKFTQRDLLTRGVTGKR